MITYGGGAFGFEVLFRLHGSAIFKSLTLAVLSCGIYLLLYFFTDINDNITNRDEDPTEELLFDHPYPIGALVSAFSFLLVFRANFAYHRYWEAFTAIHQMHSKWLDFATEVASFHYQSERYKAYAPPAFGNHGSMASPIIVMNNVMNNNSNNNNSHWSEDFDAPIGGAATVASAYSKSSHMMPVSRERTRTEEPMTKQELEDYLEDMADQATINGDATVASSLRSRLFRRKKKQQQQQLKKKTKNKKKEEAVPDLRSRMPKRKSERTKIINQRNNSKNINTGRPDDGVNNHHSSRNKSGGGLFGHHDMDPRREPTLYNEYHLSHGNMNDNFTAVARKTWREGVQTTKQVDNEPPNGNSNTSPNNNNNNSSNNNRKPTHNNNITAVPPNALFLEEIAHLLSLLSAVAMSTLRNDLENAESPLIEFYPNEPWPHVDPDDYLADVRSEWESSSSLPGSFGSMCFCWNNIGLPSSIRYMLGLSRNDVSRTLYNAARPFRVIGNVSDAEIALLQLARGPLAKVSLCSLWLQEFLSREYLQGSTGKVAPPIISRLYQYVSEGMAGYNQARKIAYIPFPFPHAQITTLFVLIIVAFMPLLMLTFVHNLILGLLLNLFTVLCFVGLHEVARELENPFQNVPNDLPLNNYQAQFNESLMIMFYGYHPDGHNWLPPSQEGDEEEDEDQIQTENFNRQVVVGMDEKMNVNASSGGRDVELGGGGGAAAFATSRSPHPAGRGHVKRLTPFNLPEIVIEDEVGEQSVLSWDSGDVIPNL